MNILQNIGKYFNDENIFTFGDKDSNAFLIKAPRDKKGLTIILSEQPMLNNPFINNAAPSYENISIQIYIESSSNNITESMNMANAIHDHLSNNPILKGTGIKAIVPKRPIFIEDDGENNSIYLVEFDAKYAK